MTMTSVKEIFEKVPASFNPAAAKEMDAVIQFDISGEEGGSWIVTIKNDTCQVQEGKHDAPQVTLAMASETWVAMANKKISGMQAFMGGKLKVRGDIMLAQKIANLFSF